VAKVLVLLAVLLALLGAARAADPTDAREIVRRSVTAEVENSRRAKNYTFLQRTEERELDDNGQVKSKQSKTYDITMLQGSSYRRLIERNDHPLLPKEEKKEEDKLRGSLVDRRHESAAQREKRVSEYDNRPGRNRAMLNEIPEAFDFRIRAEEVVDSRPVYVIEGTPRPGYRPQNGDARILLPKLKLTAWIDKADFNWARIDAEVIDTITWGLCLVKLSPGARFELQQTRVNDEVWLPKHTRATLSARVAFVKKVNMEQEATFKNFRKFQSDSQMVSSSEVSTSPIKAP
jgi:hypothetical protein